MTTHGLSPPVAERADIHKSCRALENLLNTLNEYCEAAGAIVALQKKLAKALREAAAVKVTGETAGSTFGASADIFEALADIDARFTKKVDKEYDAVSTEVKKWFKKLVREERTHDERIENANAKIKQAGQTYEKKSKKKGVDASEEHARYIALISTLGPDIAQEKHNHATSVTQRHTTTTLNVAACLARIAETEWLKACEGVRRFAPNVGNLGQWRTLCEGHWTQALPLGLGPQLDRPVTAHSTQHIEPVQEQQLQSQRSASPSTRPTNLTIPGGHDRGPSVTPPRFASTAPSPVDGPRQPLPSPGRSPAQQKSQLPLPRTDAPAPRTPPSAFDTLKQPFFDPVTGSVRTLSAFPSPPTHFPLPPPSRHQSSAASHSDQSSASLSTLTTPQPLTESPASTSQILWGSGGGEVPAKRDGASALSSSQSSQPQSSSPEQRYQPRTLDEDGRIQRPQPVRAQTTLLSMKEESIPDQWSELERELGVNDSSSPASLSKTRSYDALRAREGSSSVVAAMRNRYSTGNVQSASPPPRMVPNIPLSVSEIASKYQSHDAPVAPATKGGAASPPIASRQQSLPADVFTERKTHRPGQHSIATSTPSLSESERRRRAAEWDMRERERYQEPHAEREVDGAIRTKELDRRRHQELAERERDIEAKAKELERERARLATFRDALGSPQGKMSTVAEEPQGHGSGSGSGSEPPERVPISPLRPRRISLRKQLQRPLSQMDLEPNENGGPRGGYVSDNQRAARNGGVERQAPNAHGPYCGCEFCSVSKYRMPSQASSTADSESSMGNVLRAPVSSSEKSGGKTGGWMRRLSMPSGISNALHLDSKRNSSAGFALGSGVSSSDLSKTPLSLDGRKNTSVTSLLGRPHEDGWLAGGNGLRRGHEAHRSATNLGLGSRR